MSSGHKHKHGHRGGKIWRRTFKISATVFLILLIIFLITWAILHPRKPRFTLQDATVYAFNTSDTNNTLTSTLQVTISSRNPNDKIAIYYDRLHVYATYNDQQITLRTSIPPTYEDHKDTDVWSPFIYGTSVPIAPANTVALKQEQASGMVRMRIKIDGRVRWRVGSFTTGRYHIFVNCPAHITFGSLSKTKTKSNNAVKYQLKQGCSVSV